MHEQNHPLYATDRDHVDRLLATKSPDESEIIELARLFMRYEGFPGASDLYEDMNKTLALWGLTRDALNDKARNIWETGYRPGSSKSNSVGSGFDTSDEQS